MWNPVHALIAGLLILFCVRSSTAAEPWPALPLKDGTIEIPAQEWPLRPGPRQVRIHTHYPERDIRNVTPRSGIMLTLHYWGGQHCDGTAAPEVLADKLNVVAVCVNYLQSGRSDSIESPEPYDFGYLQALDVLRALWHVRSSLKSAGIAYDDSRLFCTGLSGGGNVTLMANKLAPRTFACVVALCGMNKLSDDIAYNLPGGSDLNARWSCNPQSSYFLSPAEQELRFIGNPVHLTEMRRLSSSCRVIVVHGTEDTLCPWADCVEMVELMTAAGLNVELHGVSPAKLDGKVFTGAGHAMGDSTQIVLKLAGGYLAPDSDVSLRRTGTSDFDLRDSVRYQTTGGEFVISYADGYPNGSFVPSRTAPR